MIRGGARVKANEARVDSFRKGKLFCWMERHAKVVYELFDSEGKYERKFGTNRTLYSSEATVLCPEWATETPVD